VSQQTVLIVTDHAEFPNNLVQQWHAEAEVPAFVVIGGKSAKGVFRADMGPATCPAHDLVIVGPLRRGRSGAILSALQTASRPVVCVAAARSVPDLRRRHPKVKFVRRNRREDWAEVVVLLANEMLRRREAQERVLHLQSMASAGERNAVLGQYLLEMRHSFNNALTSVLGNAELMLLPPSALCGDVRHQVEIIHNMALRMNEMMQRLTSMETEMIFAERETQERAPGSKRAFVF
jgi:signal transduction histidine kinase